VVCAKFFILFVTQENQKALVLSVGAVNGLCVGTLSPGAGQCRTVIEREKKNAGSPLHLEERRALPAAEWVWRAKRRFPTSNQELFAAQFVLGDNPSDPGGMNDAVSQLDTAGRELRAGSAHGSAAQEVAVREIIARDSAFQAGLRGWFERLVNPDSLSRA